jgi:RND family efflux transporter MFP subunit
MDLFLGRESLSQGIHSTNMRIHLPFLLILCLLAACSRGGTPAGAPPPPGRGGGPAARVGIVTLQNTPIEEASEFISTVRSLHSTTVQPQVDGRITNIYVKSGDVVKVGAPLVQIDAEKQAATVRNTESQRVAREADVAYWKAQVERLQVLLKAGAISQNEFDAAQHNFATAVANLAALDALQYYRVTAPTSGVVGDIAVREGDRITTSTVITTIDEKTGLEAYIQVPVDRAPDLRVGLPTQILDAVGTVVASNPITFVSPRADPATQTVLAKSLLHETPANMKIQQFVKIRVIWRSAPGLTIPITAVTRVNGQYFCFIAEPAGAGLVARQHPVQIGEVHGNDYVVRGGLKPGDRLIVSGIQKIGDGAQVVAQ